MEDISACERVLSVGVSLYDILKFMHFYEFKKLARVNRTWYFLVNRAPELLLVANYVGFSAHHVSEIARKLPQTCEQFKVDTPYRETAIDILRCGLDHPRLRVLEIFKRRSDGSVILPLQEQGSAEVSLRSSTRALIDVVFQFPLTEESVAIIGKHGTRIRRLIVSETAVDETVLVELIRRLVNIETLHLGYVSDKIDFDKMSTEIMKLGHLRSFDAVDMNVSLETLVSLKSAGKCVFNPLLDLLHL